MSSAPRETEGEDEILSKYKTDSSFLEILGHESRCRALDFFSLTDVDPNNDDEASLPLPPLGPATEPTAEEDEETLQAIDRLLQEADRELARKDYHYKPPTTCVRKVEAPPRKRCILRVRPVDESNKDDLPYEVIVEQEDGEGTKELEGDEIFFACRDDDENDSPLNDAVWDDETTVLTTEEISTIQEQVSACLHANPGALTTKYVPAPLFEELRREETRVEHGISSRLDAIAKCNEASHVRHQVLMERITQVQDTQIAPLLPSIPLVLAKNEAPVIELQDLHQTRLVDRERRNELERQRWKEVNRATSSSAMMVCDTALQGRATVENLTVKHCDVVVPSPTLIDAYLPPTDDLHASGAAIKNSASQKSKESSSARSVDVLLKKSKFRSIQLKLEANERRMMREEDRKAQQEIRLISAKCDELAAEMKAMIEADVVKRREMSSLEAVAWSDIAAREKRQRTNVLEWLEHQRTQRAIKQTGDLAFSEAEVRRALQNQEDAARQELHGMFIASADNATKAHRNRIQRRATAINMIVLDFLARLRTEHFHNSNSSNFFACISSELRKKVYGEMFPTSDDLKRLQNGASSTFNLSELLRREARVFEFFAALCVHCDEKASPSFLNQLAVAQRSIHAARSSFQNVLKSDRSQKNLFGLGKSPIVFQLDPLPEAGSKDGVLRNVLNGEFVRRALGSTFAAVLSKPALLSTLFSTLNFSLEKLSSIDFPSVRNSLSLLLQNGDFSRASSKISCVSSPFLVSPFVTNLELGGNEFGTLSLSSLSEVFPNLRRIRVNDNKLEHLVLQSDAPNAANKQLLTDVVELDISVNRLSSCSEFCTAFPNLHTLTAFANQFKSLEKLGAACPVLCTAEFSRNFIESLEGVEQLFALQTLDVTRNQLTTLEQVSKLCSLRRLFASNNKITVLAPSTQVSVFPVLTQLFVSDNQLTSIPATLYMPSLSILHAESNLLQDISGLANSPLLSTAKLSFNKLSSIASLKPLMACQRISILSVNDNPFCLSVKGLLECGNWAISSFANLRELNSEPITSLMRGIVWKTLFRQSLQHCTAFAAFSSFPTPVSLWDTCFPRMSVPVQQASRWSGNISVLGSSYGSLRCSAESGLEVLSLHQTRKVQQARTTEQLLMERTKGLCSYSAAALTRYAETLSAEKYLSSLNVAEKLLESYRLNQSPQTLLNRHASNQMYFLRIRTQREDAARQLVSRWLFDRAVCRKAAKELEAYRQSAAVVYRRKVEMAVSRIQPVWRGAWTRMRLKKAQTDDVLNEELFKPVSLDDFPVAGDKLSSFFQKVLQSAPHVTDFKVSATVSSSVSNPPRTHSASNNVSSSTLVNQSNQRLKANVQGGNGTTVGRPNSNPAQATQIPGMSSEPDDGDLEWSHQLASHLRKKENKMNKIKSESIRKEFVTDPLTAKKHSQSMKK